MAKKSMIERELKRAKLVDKYAAKRAALKTVIYDVNASDEERFDAQLKLQQLPRNAKVGNFEHVLVMVGLPQQEIPRLDVGVHIVVVMHQKICYILMLHHYRKTIHAEVK